MKKVVKILFLCLFVTLVAQGAFAMSNGEVNQGQVTMSYNVLYNNGIRALIFEGEGGITNTLALEGRFVHNSPKNYLDLFLKFKLHEGRDLEFVGRGGLHSDFNKITDVQKTLGVVFTKNHNSFIQLHGGVDYFLGSGELAYFGGLGYDLSSRAQLHLGWQKYAGQFDSQGFVFGLRTEI